MCDKKSKKEHYKEAERLGDKEYFSLRAEINDKRFVKIEQALERIEERIHTLENNHLAHLGEDLYALAYKIKKIEELLDDKQDK